MEFLACFHYAMCRRFAGLLLGFDAMLKLILVAFSIFMVNGAVAENSWLVWSEFDDNEQNIDVYLEHAADGERKLGRKLSAGGSHITPTLAVGSDLIWVAWVDRKNPDHYVLHYSILNPQSLDIVETGKIDTSDDRVYSPSMFVSDAGSTWLAWSGFDGNDEEVKLARYRGNGWGKIRQITDNHFADSLPQLTTDGSRIVLSWEQITSTEILNREFLVEQEGPTSLQKQSKARTASSDKSTASSRSSFNPEKRLPSSLLSKKKRVLMGERVEVAR